MLQYWEKFMWDKIYQMFLLGSLSGIAVLGDVIREYLLVNLIVLFVFVNMGKAYCIAVAVAVVAISLLAVRCKSQ